MPRNAPARLVGAALLALLASCATPPPPAARAAAPVPPAVDPGPVVGRDNDYVIVSARSGETMASLAERYLGDAGKAWWIAQLNNASTVREGQIVVIPLRQRNAIGVFANGYQTVPILCYHRFGTKTSKLNVTPAAFEQQMEWLARNGYTVVTLARLARFLEGKEALPAKSVAITIDDGYRSSYEIAYPILRKYGFPRRSSCTPTSSALRCHDVGADEGDADLGHRRHPAAFEVACESHAAPAQRNGRTLSRAHQARSRRPGDADQGATVRAELHVRVPVR
jgi:hypothetical protein